MKYGVLWRKTTKNIGDDMQSYAASLWLPSVDYMVDIEDMETALGLGEVFTSGSGYAME